MHQALVGSRPVSALKIMEVGLVDSNCLLELLDVLCAALAKGGLGLAVALLALFRGSIDLARAS